MEKLIDIGSEPILSLLKLLLQDKTTKKNIIWATDTYILLWKKNYQGQCDFTSVLNGNSDTMTRNLDEFPVLVRYNKAVRIIRKVRKLNEKTMDTIISPISPYAYTLPGVSANDGWTKIGFTERDVKIRIKEQTHTAGITPKLWWHYRAAYMTESYGNFTDKDFHAYLKKLGISRRSGTEWFKIEPETAGLTLESLACYYPQTQVSQCLLATL